MSSMLRASSSTVRSISVTPPRRSIAFGRPIRALRPPAKMIALADLVMLLLPPSLTP
jgi:hypothetical protein